MSAEDQTEQTAPCTNAPMKDSVEHQARSNDEHPTAESRPTSLPDHNQCIDAHLLLQEDPLDDDEEEDDELKMMPQT